MEVEENGCVESRISVAELIEEVLIQVLPVRHQLIGKLSKVRLTRLLEELSDSIPILSSLSRCNIYAGWLTISGPVGIDECLLRYDR